MDRAVAIGTQKDGSEVSSARSTENLVIGGRGIEGGEDSIGLNPGQRNFGACTAPDQRQPFARPDISSGPIAIPGEEAIEPQDKHHAIRRE